MAGRKILLVEPGYRSKYPPLGLMKIASYHRELGDEVVFVKGRSKDAAADFWDRIYIATLFSFDWQVTLDTIRYYKGNLFGAASKILVGGIAASIIPERFYSETGIYPITGCLSAPGMLDQDNDLIVDRMVPDYSILDQVDYRYAYVDSYIGYATRGCVRRCPFCAVPKLEPEFVDRIEIKPWVSGTRERYGEKKDLLLLDNNVLASRDLAVICDEIKDLGFVRGARLHGKARHVDFNQGLDARLLNERRMRLLADIPIQPFRLAYDDVTLEAVYEKAVRTAIEAGVRAFSAYILYNHRDKPTDLWDRIHHNVELSEQMGIQISSFPMKYIPVTDITREHIGPQWNRRFLRGVQCITLVTRGMVSARHDFFHKAFGRNHREFIEILSMPEHYVIYRSRYATNGAEEWREIYRSLRPSQKQQLWKETSVRTRAAIAENLARKRPGRLRQIIAHYIGSAEQ
jgi:hypothetical protein